MAGLAEPVVNQLRDSVVILSCTKDPPFGREVLDDVELVQLQVGLQVLDDFHFGEVLSPDGCVATLVLTLFEFYKCLDNTGSLLPLLLRIINFLDLLLQHLILLLQ